MADAATLAPQLELRAVELGSVVADQVPRHDLGQGSAQRTRTANFAAVPGIARQVNL